MVKKKPKSYSGEHTPRFTELCKLHAIEPLIVTATSQECTLSDYDLLIFWLRDSKMAVIRYIMTQSLHNIISTNIQQSELL